MKKVFLAVTLLALALSVASASAQTFTVLHQFDTAGDGANPDGKLLRDSAGNLFGTTFAGGIGEGTVFKIGNTGAESVLFTFTAFVSGSNPASQLVRDQSGNLFGIADEGPGGSGIVYKLAPDNTQTILFAFQGGLFTHNPKEPNGGIFMDKSGNIFGTTTVGGRGSCQLGCGSIFRLDTAGVLHVLHNFTGGADGSQPSGPLVRDAVGNLYGVAKFGAVPCAESQTGCGTVFKLARTGTLTVLHTFQGGTDGSNPQPGLLLDGGGNLFGVTSTGGAAEAGLVFKIATDGTYSVLHSFAGKADGSAPNGGLVADSTGNLFGTTALGGQLGQGTVYELTPAGQLTVLHTFTGDVDGAVPLAGLIRDSAGNLYGAAFKNFLVQQIQGGNVFKITP